MSNLDHQITVIRIVQISAYTYTLCLPVKPCSKYTVVNIVIKNLYINCCIKFDTCNLISEKFMFHSNIVNMIMFNCAEYTSHMAYNSILSTVINCVVSDNMRPYGSFAPSGSLCSEHSLHLILISGVFSVFLYTCYVRLILLFQY